MRLFVTHMHGFTPDTWRVVSFSQHSAVVRLQQEIMRCTPDYMILYVGIKAAHREEERGKLIGLAKVDYNQIVKSTDFINPEMIDEGCFRDNGTFRWPTGLEITEAELFSSHPLPDAKLQIGWQYSEDAPRNRGGYYVLNDENRISDILQLPTEPAFTR